MSEVSGSDRTPTPPPDAPSTGPAPYPAARRWWVASPGQQPQGPFEHAALTAMYRSGRLGTAMQVCAEGDTAWIAVTDLLGPPTVPPIDPAAAARGAGGPPWTQQSLVLPILATIFCCLIGGIVSIVMAAQANSKGAAGDIAGAQRDARTARNWLIISFLTPVIVLVGYLLLLGAFMLVGATAAASRSAPLGGP